LKSVGTKLRDDEYRALIERAREEGVTPSELVRRAILAYLNLPAREPGRDEILGKLGELERRIATLEQAVFKTAEANPPQIATQSPKPKKTVWDVLGEREVAGVSNVKGARGPDKRVDAGRLKG
jgi:hypothetical protein